MSAAGDLAQRGRAAAIGTGLAGMVGVLTPVWWLHDRATRVMTSRGDGRSLPIERIAAGGTDLDELLDRRQPVVVEGLVDRLDLGDIATRSWLTERVGAIETPVTLYDGDAPYFLYSGGYGAVERERRRMTMSDLLATMFDGGLADDTVVYQLLGPNSLDGATAEILDEVASRVGRHCTRGVETRFSGVWIGSPGVVTPLHHDAWPGILFQTEGTKRVAMYRPADRTNLAFRSPLRGAGRWSHLPGRSAEADPDEFPRFGRATRLEATLRPGDGLVVPPFWAHEMEAIEANISIPLRFEGPWTNRLNPGFLRPASELLRKQVATVRHGR